jgi:CRISPR/Cas system-associated exonuclease Cas4 (RecB family)
LGPYASVAPWPGFARALASTFGELRLHELHSREVGASKLATADVLAELLARYVKISKAAGVADRTRVLETAIAAVESSDRPPLGLPTLCLDVSISTPLEKRLVATLVEKSPDVLATAPSGDIPVRQALEESLECSAESISPGDDVSETVRRLQSYLFSEETPPSVPESVSREVRIVSAPGEAQEAVEIAREIHAEAERGTPFDSMAVLLRSPEAYTPLLEDALARAGIPALYASGTLRPDPAGRAFLALLDCAAEQLSASRFAEYLSLGQVTELPQLDAEGAPAEDRWIAPSHEFVPAAAPVEGEPFQLDLFTEPKKIPEPESKAAIEGTLQVPWRWEKLLVDAAVIGGKDRWERRLSGLERELKKRLEEVDDPDGSETSVLTRRLENLANLEKFALPLIEMLAELPNRAIWRDWLDCLESLAQNALVSPDGVLAVLKELRPMESVGPVELFEVREVLSDRLTELTQDQPPYRYGHVWVAPIEAARGVSFDVVLVPGLAERMFPRKIAEDPLLLDGDRVQLSQLLPTQKERIARERMYLRLAAGAARRKIVFSYPSVDLQKGRSKVPSFYLLEVARASQGELPDFEALAKQAATSSGARLGWPAPREAVKAIDETELDLAFLAEALRPDTNVEEARGTGRYLVTVNSALARSLRTRFSRSRRGKFFSSDGMLDPSSQAIDALGKHRLAARAYSVTALEKYAACPYRFFLNALQRLRPRDTVEPVTHLDALTRGSIVHEAQFEISVALEQNGLVPIRGENLARALEVCDVPFDRVSSRFEEELAPAIDRIWRDELDDIRSNLRGWVRKEAEASDTWLPIHREYTFGMRPRGPADPASVLEEAVLPIGFRLRGAIDLIEKRDDGKVRITDYKSGKAWVPAGAVVNGGQTLQPVLYALAFESMSGFQVAASRLYYCTERGGYQQRVVEPDEEALDVVKEFHRRLDQIIEEGFFPASPQPRPGCNYCDYRPVCGPHAQIEADRKQRDPRLSPLNWLRNLT